MAEWLDIPKVARLLKTTERTVRRRCVSGDLPGAVKTDGVWSIPDTADARLADRKVVDARVDADDLAKIPKPKLDAAMRRAGVIASFEKFSGEHVRSGGLRSDAMELFCLRKEPPVATLKRWISRYRQQGLLGLVDARGGAQRGHEVISPDAWDFFKDLYLDPRRPSVKQCLKVVLYRNKKEGLGWTIPRYATLCRYIGRHLPLPVQVLHREGEAAYNSKCAPYIQSDLSGIEPGAFWVGDHHQFNVLIRHGGKWVRPWVTAWEDMRSRALIGWSICIQPNSTTILQAFKDAATRYGLPDSVKIDNGRDYDSQTFTGTTKQKRRANNGWRFDEKVVAGLYNLLNIDVSFSKPYHPQSKMIERLFDTVDCQFCKFFATYCGKNTAQKPDELNDYLATPGAIQGAETLATFTKLFDEYAATYNNSSHSALDGQSPMQVFSQRESKRVVLDGVLDLLCRNWSQELTVGKNGIRHNGLYYGQFNPVLMGYNGKKVRVSCDPDDVSDVFVYEADTWKLITRAEANEIIPYGPGVADAQLREAMRRKNRALKQVKQARTAQRTAMMTPAALAREALRDETSPTPAERKRARIKIVKTVIDDQVENHSRVARKRGFKKVVGLDVQPDDAGAEGRKPVLLHWDLEVKEEPRKPAMTLTWGDDD
ncbi:MAG: DDE-type integrase/transposase/recombinase [Phycisphaerae bacterium]|nr:DDE-type integrase/transposase/recombinase [Phycisphaerae bacterium]